MRTLVTLALYVFSFVSLAVAEDWTAVQKSAIRAVDSADYGAAVALFTKAQPLARNPMEHGFTEASLGTTLYRINRTAESKKCLTRAIAEFAKQAEGTSWKVATTATLAEVLRIEGDYNAAEQLLRDTIAATPAPVAGRTALLIGLADLLREEGGLQESRALFTEALSGNDLDWQHRVDALIGIAELNQLERDYPASFERWNEAADLAQSHGAADLEESILRGTGETWLAAGNTTRAEPLLQKAVWTSRQHNQDQPGQLAASLISLANLYTVTNRLAMAIEVMSEAIQIDEALLDSNHPQLALMYATLGDVISRRGDSERARQYLERARCIFVAHFGESSPAAVRLMAVAAEVELRDHKPVEAASRYEQAMKMSRSLGSVGTSLTRAIAGPYAALLKASHRGAEAKALLAEAGTASFKGK